MSTPIYPPQPEFQQPGAAFGVTGLSPMPVSSEALQPAVTAAHIEQRVQDSVVPEAMRARLTDRLKKRKPLTRLVDIGDGDTVLVKGMDAYTVEALNEKRDPDADPDATPKITEKQPAMLRVMCFDPDSGEALFGTGEQVGVDAQTDQPIVDGWTDREINELPMDVTNKIMEAVNYVMGRTSEPGKDSPSTPATASSSS